MAVWWHLILWPTEGECHCTLCGIAVSWCMSQDPQVGHILLNWSLMKSCHLMTNRKWVTLHICWMRLHDILSYDQQQVSDAVHFPEWHMTSYPMTNRVSATVHFPEWQSHDIVLWPTECEILHFMNWSLVTSCFMTNRWCVTLHILPNGSPITFCINPQKVSCISHLLSWSLIISCEWPTGSECHCIFFQRESHDISSNDKQRVSDIAHYPDRQSQ